MIADSNKIIRDYLIVQAPMVSLVGNRIFCPRLPEKTILPAISFCTRGGTSNPYMPGIVNPSVQFSCWADDPVIARRVYRSLYDSLQGIQDHTSILSAVEEVQGQDLEDPDAPGYFIVLTFFSLLIRVS